MLTTVVMAGRGVLTTVVMAGRGGVNNCCDGRWRSW